jgi:hypothetical protein
MPRLAPALHLLLCAAACLSAAPAHAAGMRCGTKLVSDGDPLYQVKEICGVPDAQARRVETRLVSQWVNGPCVPAGHSVRCGYVTQVAVQVVVDEWTYDFGPHQFVHHVFFEQERLARIETGGYGVKLD